MTGASPRRDRVMFLYWGRRGALSRFTLELARACRDAPNLEATFSVSRQNELFGAFEALGPALFPVQTFETGLGAMAGLGQLLAVRRSLADRLATDGTEVVITLMPHLWSQLIVDVVKRAGARYVTIVHDVVHHPGEKSRRLHTWLLREAAVADRVVTLSHTVGGQLARSGRVSPGQVWPMFLPDIAYGDRPPLPLVFEPGRGPLRVLFFGRVLAYKGLPRLVEAVERLRASGMDIALGVYGDGDLRPIRARLEAIGAEVVNRWIGEEEVASVFRRYHAVVLAHSEASQSGVAAAALGAGVPVVAVPVGGIVEQVQHGETGLLARTTDAASLADAIGTLAGDAALHRRLCARIAETRPQRSMTRFLSELVSIACAPQLQRTATTAAVAGGVDDVEARSGAYASRAHESGSA